MSSVIFSEKSFFISVPTRHTPNWDLTITHDGTTDNLKNRVDTIKYSTPVTDSLGRFSFKVIDNDRTLGGKYAVDDTVTIYADNSAGTTKRFDGIVDEVKAERTPRGQFLMVSGKHEAGVLLDILVTKTYPKQDRADILRDLIDTFAPGFTYTNVVASTGSNYEANWSGKPFWDCVRELCDVKARHDCYVDNDKDFHLFERDSRLTTNDAIVYADNVLPDGAKGFGKDSFYQRNKIRIVGQDDEGSQIIYTTPNVTGTVKEKMIQDTSLRTEAQVKARHDSELEKLSELKYQGVAKTHALMNTNPGDQIWVSMREIQVLRRYRVLNMHHELGRNTRSKWMTTTILEAKGKDVSDHLKDDVDRSVNLQNVDNPNNLSYTYNFTFDDESNISSTPGTHIEGGSLVLDSGATTGSMVTSGKLNPASGSITQVEIRARGNHLGLAHYYASSTGSDPWQEVSLNRLEKVGNPGRRLFLKAELKSDSVNTKPELNSLNALFS